MAPRLKFNSFLSLFLIVPMMLLGLMGACSKSKKTGVDASAEAPIQSSSDAAAAGSEDAEGTTALEDCDEEGKPAEDAEAEDEDAEEDEEAPGKAVGKDKKGKGKGAEVKKECPAPTAGTGTAPAAGTASLADGQKIYNANCQGCHGALPGEKQGASAAEILSSATVGAHKSITPWPVAQASALSAQDAAASLAAAMK